MTRFERRLAAGIIGSWMLLSICTSVLRIGIRIASHRPVVVPAALLFEWEWLLQGTAAACLAIYVWRTRRGRFRILRYTTAAMNIFLVGETIDFLSFLAVRKYLPPPRSTPYQVAVSMFNVDLTHYFILFLGTIAITLMVDAYQSSVAAQREAADIEARLAEARVSNLRNQVKPALIREALASIESLLPDQPVRAETALLNLSDFLRLALLRTTQPAWPPAMEEEYARLQRDVTDALAS
jgi:hypothetical protein